MADKRIPKVVGIGEILWDLLPSGKQMGGAPINFLYHCQKANCETFPVSAVGVDDLGNEILNAVKEKNLTTEYIQIHSEFSTGTVGIDINQGLPTYQIHENVAWDHLLWNKSLDSLSKEADAACFGTLAQRSEISRATIHRFLQSMKPKSLKVLDINLRQNFFNKLIITESIELCNILKLNNEELFTLSTIYALSGSTNDQLSQLLELFSLKLIALTLGENGSILLTQDEISKESSQQIDLVDTVGAGDAFTAVLVNELLKGNELSTLHRKAANLASWVCTQPGATPLYTIG